MALTIEASQEMEKTASTLSRGFSDLANEREDPKEVLDKLEKKINELRENTD